MKEVTINSKSYKIPGSLSKFQKELYIHLIDWKHKHICSEPGVYKYDDKNIEYDAILPKNIWNKYPIIYPSILNDLHDHKEKYYFKFHQHFNHMASSQAANANLFLPILLNSNVNKILRQLKSDLKCIATDKLYKGFRIEYWDGNSTTNRGLLKDHTANSGTDSDIAIAYYNHNDELCLWLIEHKLTEKEFSQCNGYRSKNRDKSKHLCDKTFEEIVQNKDLCYYHSEKGREYWNLTESQKDFFANAYKFSSCPFKGGMNQLWRNQLLGFALEKEGLFKEVYFSVVKHPGNKALDKSINSYKELINNNPHFSVYDSSEIIKEAETINDKDLNEWVKWYRDLYNV